MVMATFSQLPRELRDLIWSTAAPVQYQQTSSPSIERVVSNISVLISPSIANGQPTSCTSPYAERLRQAFVGFEKVSPDTFQQRARQAWEASENVPHDIMEQPLRVYVHDTSNKDKLRLGANEFQSFLNCLPMAAVCSEARSHAIAFCKAQVGLLNLIYIVDETGEPSENLLGDEIVQPIFTQLTALMITNAYDKEDGPKGFDSAEHLVDVVSRVSGSRVERIVLRSWFRSMNSLEEIYWPHNARILEDKKDFYGAPRVVQYGDQPAVFMTPERIAYQTNLTSVDNHDPGHISLHLLKIYEVFEAAAQKLPLLQSIELELYTYSWEDVLPTKFKVTKKKGLLWVDWKDVEFDFPHCFAGFNGW